MPMKKIIVFLVILLFFSCNKKISQVKTDKLQKGYYRDYGQINDIYKNLNYHKRMAFDRCLVIGSGRSTLMMDMIKKEEIDLSEFPGFATLNIIDSIVNITRKKIVEDSIYLAKTWLRPDGEYQELSGGKRVITHCLELYSSPELDSLVKKRFKKKYNDN